MPLCLYFIASRPFVSYISDFNENQPSLCGTRMSRKIYLLRPSGAHNKLQTLIVYIFKYIPLVPQQDLHQVTSLIPTFGQEPWNH